MGRIVEYSPDGGAGGFLDLEFMVPGTSLCFGARVRQSKRIGSREYYAAESDGIVFQSKDDGITWEYIRITN